MSFKDQIKQDLSDIFLNLDEFADLHRIEGKEVPVVIDSDIMAKLSKIGDNRIHGMDEADMVIMGKASDLPENLDPGRLLNLDGREVIVVTTMSEMGLVQIAVRQNRMS
nr:MAG: ATP-binding sugar transporter [Bacteriophage sp.]